jgi:hypothetical protein
MSNGEVQPQEIENPTEAVETPTKEELPVRKTRIRKGLQRTLNTERYQTLVIVNEIEEDIEWRTLAERDKKVKNWETLLIKNFKEFHDRALGELGLEHKQAYFKDTNKTCGTPTPASTNDLDSLDSLE